MDKVEYYKYIKNLGLYPTLSLEKYESNIKKEYQ